VLLNSSQAMKIAVGAIIQETNTFSPVPATLESFQRAYYLEGEKIPQNLRNSSTEVTGFYDIFAGTQHEIIPTIAAMAVSGGRLEGSAYATLRDELLSRLFGYGKPDGLLLALHGAMCTEDDDDGDGKLLAEIRAAVGQDCLIVVTHDLHANLTRKKTSSCDGIVGYHTTPHVDHRSTGARAAKLLLRSLEEGIRPANYFRKIPMIVPSVNMNTQRSPLGPIVRRAQQLQTNPLTPSISPFWMQPWLDVEEAGAAVNVVCYGGPGDAFEALAELGDAMWQTRHELSVSLWSAFDAIRDAVGQSGYPSVFADTGDAPSGGAAGDSNYLLKAFVNEGVKDTVLLTLTDAAAVRKMYAAGPGSSLELSLGGSLDHKHFEPANFAGRVGRLSDGKFRYSGEIARGQEAEMGLAGVFEIGSIKLVVHERPVFTHDPALYRSLGLEPKEAKIVVVKTPTQFRVCYEPFAYKIYEVETPGVCNTNLRRLDFHHIPRPMFPFDTDAEVESVHPCWDSKHGA
jgi:microcystin degradation protein MlrC